MSDISTRGFTGVGMASLVAAASGYVVLVIAGNVLDKAANADFLAFWGLLFFLFGTLGGLQSVVTRSVHVERTGAALPRGAPGASVLPHGLAIGGVLAALVAVSSPLWARAALGADPWPRVALIVVAVLAFSGQTAIAGSLAGLGRWNDYSRLVGAEAILRVAAVAVAVLAGADLFGLEAAVAAAAATWALLMIVGNVRSAGRQRAELATPAFLAASGHAMLGAASSAALVVGFPVLLRVTSSAEAYDLAAPLLLAVVLTRAPLLMPLNAYQGMAITHFVSNRDQGARPLLRVAGVVVAVGLAGAGAAALVGPWLMETIFSEGYRVSPLVLAGLTLTAALLALLTLTGAATLALGGHGAYAAGWLTATACATLALLLPGTTTSRTILSLAVGPAVGIVVHIVWARRALRTQL